MSTVKERHDGDQDHEGEMTTIKTGERNEVEQGHKTYGRKSVCSLCLRHELGASHAREEKKKSKRTKGVHHCWTVGSPDCCVQQAPDGPRRGREVVDVAVHRRDLRERESQFRCAKREKLFLPFSPRRHLEARMHLTNRACCKLE